MTWEEIKNKYSDRPYRDEMTEDEEKEFVADCFSAYESDGFANVFWSQGGDYKQYHGKHFEVIGRTPIYDGKNNGARLECLPMWNIKFDDGFKMSAYPDEIILREMKDNGCPKEYLR